MSFRRGRRLGLDIGSVRIGVASSDPDGILATPLTVVRRSDEPAALKQLREIVKSCLRFIVVCAVGVYVLSQIVIRPCLTLFTDADSAVYQITLGGFPIYAVSFLLMGVGIFASSLFTAFSNGVVSAVISFARTLVFLVGMLLTLPRLLGETGIWLAVPAAETLGLAVAVGFLLWGRKRYQYGKVSAEG